jgi:DNA-binding transcriptional MerR regulator
MLPEEVVDKSPDAFRTISEVAEDLDLPQHVLRFWETRFGQIRPLKRGGGRRYYRPDDVDLLRGIRALLYGQGYTIRGVQRILKEKGLRYVQALGRGETVAPTPGPSEREEDMPSGIPGLQEEVLGLAEDLSAHHAVAGIVPATTPVPQEILARLHGVLAELVECRRLLAVARGAGAGEPDA